MASRRLIEETPTETVWEFYRPQPGHCVQKRVGGTDCLGTCGQPRSYKLKCETRGGQWGWVRQTFTKRQRKDT